MLFPAAPLARNVRAETSSTFLDNMKLPVHRWFRYSAGFSGQWVESVIRAQRSSNPVRVLDPFVGSGTTLLASEVAGVECIGIEAHPFIVRVAKAKLAWRTDPEAYLDRVKGVRQLARTLTPTLGAYPPLVRKCYDDGSLAKLDVLRQACEHLHDGTPAGELSWLTLISILRPVSPVGTAPWQYVLPKKQKRIVLEVYQAFDDCCRVFYQDMLLGRTVEGPKAQIIQGDARTCDGVEDRWANLVITSPPYPNNYDYADATRLEMSFTGEIGGWGDLQTKVRGHLIRSCSQHVPEKSVNLDEVLSVSEVTPIREELAAVCRQLAQVRLSKGGKKTYHLMVASYFRDLALTWRALRRACSSPCDVCFVIGDSAPYGVYVPVVPWLGQLAVAGGFKSFVFEKTRNRNVKWKNRKHRVPLQEGRLWIKG
jgi:hypothetical protein